MARLLLWLVLACALCKALTGRWPWQLAGWEPGWGKNRADDETVRATAARQLLGVSSRAGRGEIIEAHKRLVAQVHPDRGGTSDQVHEANAARDLLLGQLRDSLD
ncbi:molecular chaperone DnaJ [Novosphingobium piscinae]|uniref:Molecular chaperone DnaJ n=1 Tax=Novosphingobium piscinae TaxID=1507448 RepID=A0A7X1KQN5_9SPHN|nr:molecular chaperone DnaJ [Novosphingobium piscinae]MBC2669912.1 molecular chaperone DnaJ [Novosphingobium piscinae]